MEKTTSFRDMLREQTIEKPIKKKEKKRGRSFIWQVLITLILGGIIWYFIAFQQEYFVNIISNNIHYNVTYSQILEAINNIWNTLVR